MFIASLLRDGRDGSDTVETKIFFIENCTVRKKLSVKKDFFQSTFATLPT